MYHVKHCELIKDIKFPLYAPCIAFKKNFHWLQGNLAGENCLLGPGSKPADLKKYLWGAGPRIWPLYRFLEEGNTLRYSGRNVPGDKLRNIHCSSHLGIPSAIHLSSVAEPSEEWMKAYSVIEVFCLLIYLSIFKYFY